MTVFWQYDSGAVNGQTGLKEKDVVLKISNSLGWVFDNMCEGVEHNCTRYDDTFIELGERCRIANRYGANFFASFHVDSADAVGQRFTTYIHPNAPQRTRDLTQRLHDEMWNNFYSKYGVFTNGGVREADYAVLRGTNMDACLFENGFINNMEHVKLLSQFNDGGFLDQLVMAYARAFSKVFGFKLKENQNNNGGNNMATEQNKQPSDWAKDAWNWGLQKGIVDGNSHPHEAVTEEVLVHMLQRCANNGVFK